MILIPAIDLLDGKVVRLSEGRREAATVYRDDARGQLDDFAAAGAKRVHIVDLSGAFAGAPTQREAVLPLLAHGRTLGLEIEFGGGLRSADAVRAALAAGAQWAVIGSLATRDADTAAALCHEFPGQIIVAADARGDTVVVDGWQSPTNTSPSALARAAQSWGAAAVLYTDVDRDGLQGGPAVDRTAALQSDVTIDVIASGGVGQLSDLEALRDAGVRAVVVGRALYEGSFSLPEAIARC